MSDDALHSTPNSASAEDNRTEAQKNNDLADALFGKSLLNSDSGDNSDNSAPKAPNVYGQGHATSEEAQPNNAPGTTLLSGAKHTPVSEAGDYEFDLPASFSTDEGLLQEFKEVAAQHGLSQDAAQSLLNLQVKSNEYMAQQMQAQRQNWVRELRDDYSYGGRNFGETVNDATKTLRTFDPEAKISNLLEQSGFGDNPDVIRFLADIARTHLKEDKLFTARGGRAQEELALADRLWPD